MKKLDCRLLGDPICAVDVARFPSGSAVSVNGNGLRPSPCARRGISVAWCRIGCLSCPSCDLGESGCGSHSAHPLDRQTASSLSVEGDC